MKKQQETLTKIKDLIKGFFADAGEQKFESGKLADGTEVEYSALEAGGDISVVDGDGNKTPAPAGELVLEDGRIIVVTEAGKIAEVKPKPEATAEEGMAETPATEEKPAKPAGGLDWTEQIKDLQRSLTWQAERIASLVTAMEMFKKTSGDAFSQILELVDQMASEEAGEGQRKPKNSTFSEVKKQEVADGKEKAKASIAAFAKSLRDKKAAAN